MSDSVRPHRQRPWDSPGKNTGVGCHFLLQCIKVKSESEVAQSCPTLSDPMDCSLPGSSVHGIFQARVLEWGAIAFSNLTCYLCYFRKVNKMGNVRENLWLTLSWWGPFASIFNFEVILYSSHDTVLINWGGGAEALWNHCFIQSHGRCYSFPMTNPPVLLSHKQKI